MSSFFALKRITIPMIIEITPIKMLAIEKGFMIMERNIPIIINIIPEIIAERFIERITLIGL